MKALTSDGLAIPNAEVLEAMLSKHPQLPPPAMPTDPLPPSIKLSESLVLKGIRSFPVGSAPGPSGLRPSHLREAAPDQANNLLSSLTDFVNILAAGQAPSSIIPHLCGASLLAGRKKCGSFCPITVGEVLRRLTS